MKRIHYNGADAITVIYQCGCEELVSPLSRPPTKTGIYHSNISCGHCSGLFSQLDELTKRG